MSALLCVAAATKAQQPGEFTVAYGYTATSQARTAVPTPDAMAGTATAGIFLPNGFMLAGSTNTFTSSQMPGSSRTWGYGVTKVEINHDWTLPLRDSSSTHSLHLQADYVITLPTDKEPEGIEHYSHQLLGMLDYQPSAQNYFEVDAGDLIGPYAASPGYKQTALLSLIAQHNLRRNGQSGTNFDFELDASPASGGAPSSVMLTAGAEHTFQSKITLTALALVGLTANDPAIGVSIRIKFTGNLKHAQAEPRALNFSKLQRLQTTRFGSLGRF